MNCDLYSSLRSGQFSYLGDPLTADQSNEMLHRGIDSRSEPRAVRGSAAGGEATSNSLPFRWAGLQGHVNRINFYGFT